MVEQPKTRVRKVRVAIAVVIAFVLVWGFLTTDLADFGTVSVEFAWERGVGVTHLRTASGLGRILDPPYDHIFTNPLLALQVAPRISRMFETSGMQQYEGRIDYHVYLFAIVGRQVVE